MGTKPHNVSTGKLQTTVWRTQKASITLTLKDSLRDISDSFLYWPRGNKQFCHSTLSPAQEVRDCFTHTIQQGKGKERKHNLNQDGSREGYCCQIKHFPNAGTEHKPKYK